MAIVTNGVKTTSAEMEVTAEVGLLASGARFGTSWQQHFPTI
jgi:hypothetical protein